MALAFSFSSSSSSSLRESLVSELEERAEGRGRPDVCWRLSVSCVLSREGHRFCAEYDVPDGVDASAYGAEKFKKLQAEGRLLPDSQWWLLPKGKRRWRP